MNDDYIIKDPRPLEEFKDKTFSGFKKKDVYQKLFKSIETTKIEEACYWCTECIVSGYSQELFEKCIYFASKTIHINNPKLPQFIWKKYQTFLNSFNHITAKEKDKLIHLRNTQSVRNSLCDLITTLCISSKTRKFDKYPKVNDNDFQYHNIQNKLNATMQILPSTILKFTDPDELKIILNEFYFHLKNVNGGYEKACYWVAWLIHWEKINKKKKVKFEIESRDIDQVHPKYCKDPIWLLWEIIIHESNQRNDDIQTQIKNLFMLFRHDYTSGKRNNKLALLYHSIGYLTFPVKFNIAIRRDKNIYLQTQCNINIMFKNKKSHEVKEYIEPPPKINKKKNINLNKEIDISKFNSLIDIDELTR